MPSAVYMPVDEVKPSTCLIVHHVVYVPTILNARKKKTPQCMTQSPSLSLSRNRKITVLADQLLNLGDQFRDAERLRYNVVLNESG